MTNIWREVGVGWNADEAAEPDLVDNFLEMLEKHPDALVVAIGDDGITVPMPACVPLDRHRVVGGRSVLDMVIPIDKFEVINTWERSRNEGGASMVVRLVAEPERPVLATMVNAVARFGVHLGIITPADGNGGRVTSAAVAAIVVPRTARVRKSELAIVLHIDDATTQILGWPSEQIVGRRTLEFIHPDDQERALGNWMEMLTTPGRSKRVRLRHLTASGAWVWLEVTNHNNLTDAEPSVLAEMLDISEEVSAQEALCASEQRLRRLAEALPLGILRIERDRRISYANERTAIMTCADPSESVDEQFEHVIAEDRQAFAQALDAVLDGQDQDISIRLRFPGASLTEVRHCTVSMRATTSAEGDVTDAIVSVADVSDQVRMTEELERRATYDALTGCFNRPALISMLDAMLNEPGIGVGIVFIDLDEFKAINDERGHAAGDAVLRAVGARLGGAVRSGDLVGRVGGDEFVVVCRHVEDIRAVARVAAKLESALEGGVMVDGHLLVVSGSFGVAHTIDRTTSSDRLIEEADERMYIEKRTRKNDPAPVALPRH